MVARWIESNKHSLSAGIGRLHLDLEETPIRRPELIREVFLVVAPFVASLLWPTDLRIEMGLLVAPVYWRHHCLHPHHAVLRHLPRCRTW